VRTCIDLLLVVVLSWAASGCQGILGPKSDGNSNQLLPLHVGNQWVYSVTVFDSSGNQTSSYLDTAVVKIDTTIAGLTWYLVPTLPGIDTEPGLYLTYYANENDGLWERLSSHDTVFQVFFFKYPANEGESWETHPRDSSCVRAADCQLSVPYGSLHCIKYQMGIEFSRYDSVFAYFKPGLGLVMFEEYLNNGNQFYSGRFCLAAKAVLVSASVK